MDPVTGRPALTVSLDLKVRMDVVALVEILASIANSQVEGGEEEEEQTAEAGQEEEEEEGREETEAADDAALLTGKPRIRAEETARCRYPVPKTRFCWRDFWASRPRVTRSLSPETTFSRTRFLPPRRPHRVRKRLASGRGKLAAGIVENVRGFLQYCTNPFRCVVILRPGVGPEVRAVLFSLELRWRGLKERLSGVFDISLGPYDSCYAASVPDSRLTLIPIGWIRGIQFGHLAIATPRLWHASVT